MAAAFVLLYHKSSSGEHAPFTVYTEFFLECLLQAYGPVSFFGYN